MHGDRGFQRWLRGKCTIALAQNLLLAVAGLAGGAALLALIFFLAYGIVWFGFNHGVSAIANLLFGRRLQIPHAAIVAISAAFLALLFVENARVSRDYWTDYGVPRTRSVLWLTGILGAIAALLGNVGSSTRMSADLLLSGPRLIMAAGRALRRCHRLFFVDLRRLALGVSSLASRTSPASLSDLVAESPHSSPEGVLTDLLALQAVILLRPNPPLITLDPDLREEILHRFGRAVPEAESDRKSPPVGTGPDAALLALFGLPPSASRDDLRTAFRKTMKQCHPDLFSGASETVRQAAEQKTQELLAAYETLLERFRSEPEVQNPGSER